MFKKSCQDLFLILFPLFLILFPHPIFAQDADYSQAIQQDNEGMRDAIRYWWIAPLALIPLAFFLWPKEEGRSDRPAYRNVTTYSSVRRSRSKKGNEKPRSKRNRASQ